jgi:hypothetical protein
MYSKPGVQLISLILLLTPAYTLAQSDGLLEEPTVANNVPIKQPGPIPRARWSEDWSVFGDPAPLVDSEESPAGEFWHRSWAVFF